MVIELPYLSTAIEDDIQMIEHCDAIPCHRNHLAKPMCSWKQSHRKSPRQLKIAKKRRPLSTLYDTTTSFVKPRHENKPDRPTKPSALWETQKGSSETIDRSLLCGEMMLLFDLFGIDMYHRARLDNMDISLSHSVDSDRLCSYGPTFASHRSIIHKFEQRLLTGINRATAIHATDILARVTLRMCELARFRDAHMDKMLLSGKVSLMPSDASSPCLQTSMSTQVNDWVLLYPWDGILNALASSKAISAASTTKISQYIETRAQQLSVLAGGLGRHEEHGTTTSDFTLDPIHRLATRLSKISNSLSARVSQSPAPDDQCPS